jgi:hypothetical protein
MTPRVQVRDLRTKVLGLKLINIYDIDAKVSSNAGRQSAADSNASYDFSLCCNAMIRMANVVCRSPVHRPTPSSLGCRVRTR